MKQKTRTILSLVLVLVFLISTAMLLRQFRDNAGGGEAYADALAIAAGQEKPEQTQPVTEEATEPSQPRKIWIPAPVEDDPVVEEMAEIDLAALREVSPDVLGWIRIPDTKIDYPIMRFVIQAPSSDGAFPFCL